MSMCGSISVDNPNESRAGEAIALFYPVDAGGAQ